MASLYPLKHLSIAVDPTNSKRIIEYSRLAVNGFAVTNNKGSV
jgi:hypothetical protein